jgi:hypothetical protein
MIPIDIKELNKHLMRVGLYVASDNKDEAFDALLELNHWIETQIHDHLDRKRNELH